MKKSLFTVVLIMSFGLSAFAQSVKLGYVDSDRIIEEYKEVDAARRSLETFTAGLEREATEKQKAIVELNQQLQSQALMLSEERKRDMERQITQLTQEYQAFLQKNFGQQGDVAQRNNQLMIPIMKNVKEAIDKVAKESGYTMVFDNAVGLLYGEPALDITDQVLRVLNAGQ